MEHFGILSIIPPLTAVILAIVFRNVIISLFTGILVGILILVSGNPITAFKSLIGEYFFIQLTDSYNAGVIVLLVFIGGFVALMEKSGGAAAFAEKSVKFLNNRVKTQIGAWFGGIVIFFSDLGTPLIVGPIFEKIFDAAKVSREKLAWIIDSTASPVAILIPFIGWGVYIMGLIQKEFESLSITTSDWTAFVKAIPFQFYAILSVVMVPIIIFTKLDFSRMAKAEHRVLVTGERFWPDSQPLRKPESIKESEGNKSKAILIWLPLLVLLGTMIGLLIPLGFPFEKIGGNDFRIALTLGYLFAAIVLMALIIGNKVKSFKQTFDIYMSGMQRMMYVVVTLILAWSLGSVIKNIGTSNYIIQIMDGNISPVYIPAIIFVVGAAMSFATGSSWGTFAIMMPLAIPLAVQLDAPLFVCIGAVLSGGLFGDHCSPISDTTLLASTGAGADHADHVNTQLPYAVLNGSVAFLAYILAGFTESTISLAAAIVLMVVTVIILAKRSRKKLSLDNTANYHS